MARLSILTSDPEEQNELTPDHQRANDYFHEVRGFTDDAFVNQIQKEPQRFLQFWKVIIPGMIELEKQVEQLSVSNEDLEKRNDSLEEDLRLADAYRQENEVLKENDIAFQKEKEKLQKKIDQLRSDRRSAVPHLSVETQEEPGSSSSATQPREETLEPVDKKARSEKLPDPEVFNDGNASQFYAWKRKMKMKLSVNSDRYPSIESKASYIMFRLGSEASQYVGGYEDSNEDPMTPDEMFEHLEQRYGDSDRRMTARTNYVNLRQKNTEFSTFISDFYRFAAEAKINKEDQVADLRDKLSSELKEKAVGLRPKNVFEFVKDLQHIDRNLQDVRKGREAAAAAKKKREASSTTNPKPADKATTPARREGTAKPGPVDGQGNPIPKATADTKRENVQCFYCKKEGHYVSECPKSRAKAVAAVAEKEEPSPKS